MVRALSFSMCLIFLVILGVVAPASAGKSIALVLDASNSMNSQLPDGTARIDAAKAAVDEIVSTLPEDVRLSLRVYGHQSPTAQHDCRDTALEVGFGPLSANKAEILARTQAIKAQGYTPISYVLQLAAEDLGKEDAQSRVVILVSDGKETCPGDPCATAKALADANASLVVHTIGFAVDTAAKYQLQCVARLANGKYWDAGSADQLSKALAEAATTEAPPAPSASNVIVITKPKPGKLQVNHADARGHKVTQAASDNAVGKISSFQSVIELPAGLYNVSFGTAVWKSVEVKAGETTVLDPGVLQILNANASGHELLDAETGAKIGSLSSFESIITVLPSTFSVTFGNGKAVWKGIEVKPGEQKVLNPGVVVVIGASGAGYPVFAEDSTQVGKLSSFSSQMALPPGKYSMVIDGQVVSFELSEGQRQEIRLQ